MLIKLTTILLVCVYLAKAIPVENENPRKPIVIDIPAGPPPEDEPTKSTSGEQTPEVTKGVVSKPVGSSDVETIGTDTGSGSDETVTDFKPTFVIIRTRPIFSSFGSFGPPQSQSPFFSSSGSSPFGGSLFGNSPFLFRNPMRDPANNNKEKDTVGSSSSDSSEAVTPFQGPFARPSYFNVDDVMTRLQQQMSSLWGTLLNTNNRPRPAAAYPFRPFPSSFNPFVDSSVEDTNSNGTSSEEVFNIDKLPANYTNSTSETKVIDGNVVQVNRTIHKISSGNNTRGFFQFQVINVQPKATTEKVGTTNDDELHHGETDETKVVNTKETVTTDAPSVTSVPTTKSPTSTVSPNSIVSEADPALNEVDEHKAHAGIDHGLL